MSRAMILNLGTGRFKEAAGVKTAKLYVEQNQIGKRLSAASTRLSGRLHKDISNGVLRGMTVEALNGIRFKAGQNPAYGFPKNVLWGRGSLPHLF